MDLPTDGVVFEKDSISVEEITLKKEYNGVRVHVKVGLDTASQVISMDVGFGDIITPAPVDLSYPVLLDTSKKSFMRLFSVAWSIIA